MCATDVIPINVPTYYLCISTFDPLTVKGIQDDKESHLLCTFGGDVKQESSAKVMVLHLWRLQEAS